MTNRCLRSVLIPFALLSLSVLGLASAHDTQSKTRPNIKRESQIGRMPPIWVKDQSSRLARLLTAREIRAEQPDQLPASGMSYLSYHSFLTAACVLAVLIVVWRNRHLLPASVTSRLPTLLQPSSSAASSSGLPFPSTTTSSSSNPASSFFSRLFGTLSPSSRNYSRLPLFDWNSQASAGLSSTLFDINSNIADGDSRSGLDPTGAQDVQTIMQTQGVSFDQARLIRHKQILVRNNIDPNTGLPLDSKAITSLGGRTPGGSRGG